jgi:hypothetical protein
VEAEVNPVEGCGCDGCRERRRQATADKRAKLKQQKLDRHLRATVDAVREAVRLYQTGPLYSAPEFSAAMGSLARFVKVYDELKS